MGSNIFPKSETTFHFRDKYPSNQSLTEPAKKSARIIKKRFSKFDKNNPAIANVIIPRQIVIMLGICFLFIHLYIRIKFVIRESYQ